MFKKFSILSALMALLIIVAGCSSLNLPGAKAATTTTPQNPLNEDLTNQPLSAKLAIGTLMLEGTNLAVNADQATQLIPLWKAVISLGSSNNTSQQETDAVYTQIEGVMTPDQINAIKKMSMTTKDTQALMQKLGVQVPQFGNGGGNFQNLTQSQRETQIAQFAAQGGGNGNFRGGFDGGAGAPPGGGNFGGGGGVPGGNTQGGGANQSGTGTTRAQRTPSTTQLARRQGGGNFMAQELIRVLQERAGLPTNTPSVPFGRPGGNGTPGPNETPAAPNATATP
jgi:hypothetical protein